MSTEKTVWNFLRNKNLPEKSVAAVMGNIYAESGFDLNLIEEGNGIGFGLCQWSFERRNQLERYGTDLKHQLNFLWAELSGKVGNTGATFQWIDMGSYLSHSNFMDGKGGIDDLTSAMCFCWERPNASLAHLDRRQQKAKEYFKEFTGSSGGDSANLDQGLVIESTNYQVVQGSKKYGDYLFGRKYRITVSDSSGNGLDISKLHCIFNAKKSILMEPNILEIAVYNLNVQTENTIIMSGVRVTIEAGYEGSQFGLIFDGDILQCIREKEEANTFKLTIIALDGDRAINFDVSNFSIVRGQTQRSMVNHIANKASSPVNLGSISDALKDKTLTRGKVFFGKSSDYLRQIAKSNSLHYYMDNGSINLINLKDLPKDEIFELSPNSGLVGTPEQTEYGISGQCLLNPQIKLNSLIHVDNSLVRAKRIDFNTSNTVPSGGVSTNNTTRDKIIAEAKKICDDPKVQYSMDYRGQTINGITYWDCSSFVKQCYKVAGLDIVDITYNQYAEVQNNGKFILESEAIPGDIVFWGEGSSCYHVAIYAGNGHIYAAAGNEGIAPKDQVLYQKLYGSYKIGRPKCLADSDKGLPPSANNRPSEEDSKSNNPTLIRALDKDGIYRVIKTEYIGDTRGNDWYVKFETISQVGGVIPTVSN